MWYEKFDGIYLITLKRNIERWRESAIILHDYGIPFKTHYAVRDEIKPHIGLVKTMQDLFKQCLLKRQFNVLIFEDDIKMILDKKEFNEIASKCVEQLPSNYNVFYFGCNHPDQFLFKYSDNLLPIKAAYSTHAAAYSKEAMEFIIEHEINEPIDVFLVDEFQPHKRCYCSYPMLISQRKGYSDIEKKERDYSNVLERRFEENTQIIKWLNRKM